ncbi:MAG TPA: endolytic transglycosylase MltG [Candidatus Saccharibacteria bacterium]|nr:endolytic transglycosylase MltG [Candidatus Saccharibacteria bacterium]
MNKADQQKRDKWIKRTIIGLIVAVVIVIVSAVIIRQIYTINLRPLSNSQEIVIVEVPSGYSAQQIGEVLEKKGVIKQSWAFNWYVRTNGLIEGLKAGTYALRPSQNVAEVADTIAGGEIATDLVTILPGQRIDQVRSALINSGFTPESVDLALDPATYPNHPALVDKPKGANLEGYLYPETFQKNASTKASDIVRASLDEMQTRLTPSIRRAIAKQGLSVYEGIILASIVEQEVANIEDKSVVASVFYNRLNKGTKLESDVTVLYGAIAAGEDPSLRYDSKYNTFTNIGLPIGPISNVSKESLAAVAAPKNTDYIFFVAGDDGNTYFSRTLAEHEEAIDKHCIKLCQ